MEDLDAPRVMPGCADQMLRVLEGFGLHWDGQVEYQSARTERYAAALDALQARGSTFACSCSRRELAGMEESGYPGTCRSGPVRAGPTAVRFRIDDSATVLFEDRFQGPCRFPLRELGDVAIRRRDGLYCYQLAVIVDDCAQGITDVVRGADLLASTPWQIELARALDTHAPRYAHLPLIVEPDGTKLAKSRRSVPVDLERASPWLAQALRLLGQEPPPDVAQAPPPILLAWAVAHWDGGRLPRRRNIAADLGPQSGL